MVNDNIPVVIQILIGDKTIIEQSIIKFGMCVVDEFILNDRKMNVIKKFLLDGYRFCETRSKRSVEVYRGRNLHPPPRDPPQTVTDILECSRIVG